MAKKCFVITPIGPENSAIRAHADQVFQLIVQPAADKLRINAFGAHQLARPGKISDQMYSEIFSADLCIAILTGHNPNVFYELALAQSINKPVIPLLAKGEDLPFDVKDFRYISYDLDSANHDATIKLIIDFARSIEQTNWKVDDIFEPYRELSNTFVDPQALTALNDNKLFCENAKGYWWSRNVGTDNIGFVTLKHDPVLNTLEKYGQSYDANARVQAIWKTTASCVDSKKNSLYYFWEGKWPSRPNDRHHGFGQINFHPSNGLFNAANDEFFDRIFSDVKMTTMKESVLRRCTKQEVATMLKGQRITNLIKTKLEELGTDNLPG